MEKPPLRTLMVVLAVVFAIGVPAWQALNHFGLSAAAFAGQGDSTLRAQPPWAFSIWSVVYLGLVIYALWQAWPRVKENPTLQALAWPSVVTVTGCGVWILASALNLRWASVGIILVSAGTLIAALVRAPRPVSRAAFWPLALLAGWLTIASALNILTVMTAEDMITRPEAWAMGGLAAVTLVGATATWSIGSLAYTLPIVWGLIGVWAAEQDRPDVATTAGAAAFALLIVGVTRVLVRRGGVRIAPANP